MKKYIKPCIEQIAVESLNEITAVSEVYNQPGDPSVGQLSKGRRDEEAGDDDWW